jgi:hypothetical protein
MLINFILLEEEKKKDSMHKKDSLCDNINLIYNEQI